MLKFHNLPFLEPNLNPLPHNKILYLSKLKAVADNNLNVAQIMNSLFDREEPIVGKGGNGSYLHFRVFPQCFQLPFLSGLFKVGNV